jgi:gluconokinase
MADIFGYELLIPDVSEASAFGAALLAMHAAGALADLSDSRQLVQIIARRQPDPELTSLYRELFHLFQKLYDNLRDEFAALAQLRKDSLAM